LHNNKDIDNNCDDDNNESMMMMTTMTMMMKMTTTMTRPMTTMTTTMMMTTMTSTSAMMQAQRRDDRALKMDVQRCARMSGGLHGGQWQKRAADDGVDRGGNNQPLMRAAKARISGWQ
jgi:hypothetical protein